MTKRPVLRRRPAKPEPATPSIVVVTREQPPRLLTTREVCQRCGNITKVTLWRWLKRGIYPQPIVINGRNYFDESKHDAFVASHQRAPEVA